MPWKFSFAVFIFLISQPAFASGPSFSLGRQCKSFKISKGNFGVGKGKPGEGKLLYCDNGIDQRILLSGTLDEEERKDADFLAVKAALAEFKSRKSGVFEVITKNAGGGNTEWHSLLMMGVEDACTGDCRIATEVQGRCESACNQLHLTCVVNASTLIRRGGATCDHAETDEIVCHDRDPNPPHQSDICPLEEQIAIYKDRCGKLLGGRNLTVDDVRRQQIFEFVDRQAKAGVFSTSKLTCQALPWATTQRIVGK